MVKTPFRKVNPYFTVNPSTANEEKRINEEDFTQITSSRALCKIERLRSSNERGNRSRFRAKVTEKVLKALERFENSRLLGVVVGNGSDVTFVERATGTILQNHHSLKTTTGTE